MSQTRPTLSVLAISYNEQVDLPGFIAHLIDWVDEIVIVDDGSTDATESIARQAGPKLKFISSKRGPDGSYGEQRNKALDASTGAWVLHMDIDERVGPEFRAELLEAIRSGQADAYVFKRQNFFLHRPIRHGSWARYTYLHLARREVMRLEGALHETPVLTPGARVGQLKAPIHHLNEDAYLKRLYKDVRYIEVEARDGMPVSTRRFVAKLLIQPTLVFLREYVWFRGCLDGVAGFLLALRQAQVRLDYNIFVWERHHRIARADLEKRF